jgi:hypothetical protein
MKNSTETRHGKRAEGVVTMTIPMPLAVKEAIEALAQKDERSAASWVRLNLQKLVKRSRAARKQKAAA